MRPSSSAILVPVHLIAVGGKGELLLHLLAKYILRCKLVKVDRVEELALGGSRRQDTLLLLVVVLRIVVVFVFRVADVLDVIVQGWEYCLEATLENRCLYHLMNRQTILRLDREQNF